LDEFQNWGYYDGYIFLKEVDDPMRFGVAKFDANRKLIDVIEKPKQPPRNYTVIVYTSSSQLYSTSLKSLNRAEEENTR